MHRALLIEEIVARIATEADRKTAWALAQACRAFTEPALDAVWAIATYPGVLAGLMSEDLWTIKRPPEGSGNNYPPLCSLRFADDVDATRIQDFGDRFAYHARRVRGLILDRCNYRLRVETDDVDFVVNPEVVAAWARQLHLFPQLRMLQAGNCFAPTSQPAHVFNRLVQVPNLTTLTLSDTQRILDNPMTETDKQILAACPRLETLELRLKWFVDDAEGLCQLSATLLVPMLATATRLRSLRLVGMPLLFISLRHLGSVPGLCRLDIDGEILEVPPGPRLFSTSCFPALRALRISDSTAHGQLARSLLQCCTSPQLTELRIYIGREDADVSAQDLLGSFALIGQHTRLAHLRLSLCGVAHAPPASLFRSLPPLQHLTSLWLSTPHASAPLASDDVLVVVSLFPRLVRWHVGTEGKQDGAPASLNTLLRILRGRPALRLLPVVIASGDPPAGDVVAAFGTHGYGPYLQADSGHEIDGLWAMIAKLFPRVKMDRCKYVQTRTLKEALQAF